MMQATPESPQQPDILIAEAMHSYKAGDYPAAAATFGLAHTVAVGTDDSLAQTRAARGAAESYDQAGGRTGQSQETRNWLLYTQVALGRLCEPYGFDINRPDQCGRMVVNEQTYQLVREVVQTFGVMGKLMGRRLVRAALHGEEDPKAAALMLRQLRTADGLLLGVEDYDNGPRTPDDLKIDQYRINLLAPFGFGEGCFGDRQGLVSAARQARRYWRISETYRVANSDPRLSDPDREAAQHTAHRRAQALTAAVYAPRVGRLLLAKKAL